MVPSAGHGNPNIIAEVEMSNGERGGMGCVKAILEFDLVGSRGNSSTRQPKTRWALSVYDDKYCVAFGGCSTLHFSLAEHLNYASALSTCSMSYVLLCP